MDSQSRDCSQDSRNESCKVERGGMGKLKVEMVLTI